MLLSRCGVHRPAQAVRLPLRGEALHQVAHVAQERLELGRGPPAPDQPAQLVAPATPGQAGSDDGDHRGREGEEAEGEEQEQPGGRLAALDEAQVVDEHHEPQRTLVLNQRRRPWRAPGRLAARTRRPRTSRPRPASGGPAARPPPGSCTTTSRGSRSSTRAASRPRRRRQPPSRARRGSARRAPCAASPRGRAASGTPASSRAPLTTSSARSCMSRSNQARVVRLTSSEAPQVSSARAATRASVKRRVCRTRALDYTV